VTEKLFYRYRNVEDFANANINDLMDMVKSVNYYRTKAKHIKEMCEIILEKYGGNVPDSMGELIKLPGVQRKTANIVLSNAFEKDEGIAVDTHVMRVSQRLGITDESAREKIERDLMGKFPRNRWSDVSNLLIAHGRNVCKARNPACEKCILNDRCRYYKNNMA
jgi:endonuclease III